MRWNQKSHSLFEYESKLAEVLKAHKKELSKCTTSRMVHEAVSKNIKKIMYYDIAFVDLVSQDMAVGMQKSAREIVRNSAQVKLEEFF